MEIDALKNFIDWFKQLLLDFEAFFHDVQGWFEGEVMGTEWFKNVINSAATKTDAETTTTA